MNKATIDSSFSFALLLSVSPLSLRSRSLSLSFSILHAPRHCASSESSRLREGNDNSNRKKHQRQRPSIAPNAVVAEKAHRNSPIDLNLSRLSFFFKQRKKRRHVALCFFSRPLRLRCRHRRRRGRRQGHDQLHRRVLDPVPRRRRRGLAPRGRGIRPHLREGLLGGQFQTRGRQARGPLLLHPLGLHARRLRRGRQSAARCPFSHGRRPHGLALPESETSLCRGEVRVRDGQRGALWWGPLDDVVRPGPHGRRARPGQEERKWKRGRLFF